MSGDEYGGFDGLTRWLGLRWESFDRVRLTVRPDLINPAGLLAGPVAYAMVAPRTGGGSFNRSR